MPATEARTVTNTCKTHGETLDRHSDAQVSISMITKNID